jgi:uncharacterized protein YegL
VTTPHDHSQCVPECTQDQSEHLADAVWVEPDEDPHEVLAAFERGEKGVTTADAERAFEEMVELGQQVDPVAKKEGDMTERAHVTLVVDRSGSMTSLASEANAGIEKFIKEQAEIEGVDTYVSLIQFDDEYDHVFGPVLASEAPEYKIEPRAMTALYDAIGRSIRDTKQWVDPHQKVVIVIMTDGFENASHEFTTRESIATVIEQAKADHDWQFIFLAGTLESAQMATNSGLRGQTMAYDPSVRGQTIAAYSTASANTTAYLSGAAAATVMPESVEDDDAP